MAIVEQWNIKTRAPSCARTGKPFTDGQPIFTVLFEDPKSGELSRADYSEAGWQEVEAEAKPFSHWRSRFEVNPPTGRPEVMEKATAETLLRRMIEEDSPLTESTRYILAVMLERKKLLRQTGTRETPEETFLIYEHTKTGEVYIVRDPELRLDQIEAVQNEVSRLLPGGSSESDQAA